MPTPAPDIPTLFDVATAVETAVKSLLAQQDPPIVAFMQRECDVPSPDDPAERVPLPSERVDIQFTLGAWTGHWAVDRAGKLRHGAWAYTLQLNVSTDAQPTDPAAHGRRVGLLRALFQSPSFDELLGEDVLPFHCLASCDHQTAAPQVNIEQDTDVSPLVFTGVVSIRSGVWPLA